VDALWLLAIVFWCEAVREPDTRFLPLIGLHRGDLRPISALLLVFATAWLPFFDNWRWAYTGDSGAWFAPAAQAARHGLAYDILSMRGGPDNHFTYLHALAFNAFMFVFGPTLFWHRVGKLLVSCLSLGAIYTYFRSVVGRRWALGLVAATAVNYVWLWFSYVSYGHIDSFVFYYLTLALLTVIWRRPDCVSAWLFCGLIGGLSLFFTQTAWSAVAAGGGLLLALAAARRRWRPLVAYAGAFSLAAAPVILQLAAFLTMNAKQAKGIYDWDYLSRIFIEIVKFPWSSTYRNIGVDGAFLRFPLGHLYPLGLVLAVLGLLPPLRRVLRLPACAPALLALLLWDALLMTLTNNGYSHPSTKRAYNLIPLYVFFSLLPLMMAGAWARRRQWASRSVAALVAAALCVYAGANLSLIASPKSGVYGINAFDGLIELRQRFAERRVVFFTSRKHMRQWTLGRDSFVRSAYHLDDTVEVEQSITESALTSACRAGAILCYEPAFDRVRFRPLAQKFNAQPFPLLNSRELRCYECG